MQVAVGEVLHLEDLPQRDIGDIHAEAAHAAVFVDLAAELVEKLAVDIELTAEPPIREGLTVGNGIVQLLHDGIRLFGQLLLDMGGVQGSSSWVHKNQNSTSSSRQMKQRNHISCPRMPTVRRFFSGCRINRKPPV